MIFGTFDGLHPGHHFLVKQAMSRGSVTIVVGTDEHIALIKGRTPLESLEKRMSTLRRTFPTARIIAGSSDDFLAPLRTEKPDLILLGYDQKLPPGISLDALTCPWERAEALKPELYKSSLLPRKRAKVLEENSEK